MFSLLAPSLLVWKLWFHLLESTFLYSIFNFRFINETWNSPRWWHRNTILALISRIIWRKIESYAMSWFSWDTFALCYVKKETKRNKISSQPNSNCCMFIVQMCVIKSIHKIHRTLKISCTKSGLHFVSCCKKAYYSSKDAYSQSHYIKVMQGAFNWL